VQFAKLVWQVVYFTFNILPSKNIMNLFGKWLNGIDKSVWVFVHFFGQYEIVKMMLFLTIRIMLIFCRSSTRLFIGLAYGPFSYRRNNGEIWILSAIV
jgi:hypothetical protein